MRLRQVACHPGLVDAAWEDAGSAKLEALFDQISEVLEEGHKLLIFSQFTKLLAYVQRHLEEQEIDFAYLDGKTRNRGEVVERFQTDPDCNVFVISLKAGGLGLNLTGDQVDAHLGQVTLRSAGSADTALGDKCSNAAENMCDLTRLALWQLRVQFTA